MSQQPMVFRKNLIDLDYSQVSITVTDSVATSIGSDFVNLMRNRDNDSGHMTTGSDDSANTEYLVEFGDAITFDTIIFVLFNFKSYKVEYYDDDSSAFTSLIDVTDNAKTTNLHQFTSVTSTKIKITARSTIVADADKIIRQLIVTRKVEAGQFEGWPTLKKVSVGRGKKSTSTLSGKTHLVESAGNFSLQMEFKTYPSADDLTLLEAMHFNLPVGFLFWPCGGDEDQFQNVRAGYRLQDIYLMKCTSEWETEWNNGYYKGGLNIKVTLAEII